MVSSFSDHKYIYSVDMMFAYINIFKKNLTVEKVLVVDLVSVLDIKGWYNKETKEVYSANDVLKNPKKYPNDIKRIKEADMKYPIIMYNGEIVDGVHRLVKATLDKNKFIKAYVFDYSLMNKFKIGKLPKTNNDWLIINEKFSTYKLIENFYNKFS